ASASSCSRSLVLWMPVVLGRYMLRLAPVFVSAWNPHVVILPAAALIVVSAAVASGQARLLPLVIVLGSFCVQTHLAVAPAVMSLWAFALLMIVVLTHLREISTADARKWVNAAMWTSAVCW